MQAWISAQTSVPRPGDHSRLGYAQRLQMFPGLLAQLFERRAFRQMTRGNERHDDLLSDIARVRSTG
jgi:hypothetical protein